MLVSCRHMRVWSFHIESSWPNCSHFYDQGNKSASGDVTLTPARQQQRTESSSRDNEDDFQSLPDLSGSDAEDAKDLQIQQLKAQIRYCIVIKSGDRC